MYLSIITFDFKFMNQYNNEINKISLNDIDVSLDILYLVQ